MTVSYSFLYTRGSVGCCCGDVSSLAVSSIIEYNRIHYLGFGLLSDMGGIYSHGQSP